MMPRTKLPIPEPGPSEFKNFDRLVGVLLSKPVKSVRKEKLESARTSQDQEAAEERRLPRP
jgi:hypothetical protein